MLYTLPAISPALDCPTFRNPPMKYFWSSFEEPADGEATDSNLKTETRAREESDQRSAGFADELTCTAVREEQDQRRAASLCVAGDSAGADPLETMTKSREEQDQRASHRGCRTFPQLAGS